ncbi:MAG TPA: sigma-70 family RNA polymerase sigma factor [Bacteroidales bacterium]|nr:sigma-70 family RNA polymerase sigma factor [Bacteroidales bacterium]
MIYFSDEALLKGLKERETDCIKQLYREFFPIAKSIVERNSGNHQDAEDVFQDSIVVLYQKISREKVTINCSLKTFFYSICRNIWRQRLDRKWRLVYHDELVNEPVEDYEPELFRVDEKRLERTRLFQLHFLTLPKDCQKVLTLFLGNISLREIATIMGFKDESYAKTRKYLCKNMLRKRIMKDPTFKRFFQHE